MKITVHASGSSGNCYTVEDGGRVLLLEAGLTAAAIKKALNYRVSGVDGCLVSHEHLDHGQAARDLMKMGVDCYMTAGTAGALGVSGHRLKPIMPGKQFKVAGWTVLPFSTVHDAAEPVGFLIKGPVGKLLFASDTAYLVNRFKGLTHIMIEANYCPEILEKNIRSAEYPRAIRNRVVKNHMSIDTTIKTLLANDLSAVREIHLIHLSGDNADPEAFKRRVEAATGKPVYVHGRE